MGFLVLFGRFPLICACLSSLLLSRFSSRVSFGYGIIEII